MDNKNAPREDEVLLEELTSWVEDYKDAAERNALAESPTESAKYLISKAREAVEGVGLTEADISDKLWKLAITDMSMMCSIVAEAQTKAILKALGGE